MSAPSKVIQVSLIVLLTTTGLSTWAAEDKRETRPAETKPMKLDWTKFDWAKLNDGSVADYARPLAPGVYGKSPFCAPSFAFKAVEGAKHYRFTVTHWDKNRANPVGGATPKLDGDEPIKEKAWVFEASEPLASLTPVWNDAPVCTGGTWLRVVVEGLDAKGGKPIAGAPQESHIRKGQPWKGPFDKPKVSLREASLEAMRHSLAEGVNLQYTFYRDHRLPIEGKRGPDLAKFEKIETVFVAGAVWIADSMSFLARESKNPEEAAVALKTARNAADSLINTSNPADWKYASFPNMVRSRGKHWKAYLAGEKTYEEWLNDMYAGSEARYEMMQDCRACEAGFMYLDMYDVTKDTKYLDAAKRLAEAYRKTQLPSGTWPYLANGKTGEPLKGGNGEYPPALAILFLDRLASQYGVHDYEQTADQAFRWVLENQVKIFDHKAHFHDVGPRYGPGGSQGALAAVEIAMCLFARGEKDAQYIPLGEEYLRRVEDKFIHWEEGGRVSEQTGYMPRIGFTGGGVSQAFVKAFEATGNPLYLAKALTMAQTLMTEFMSHSGAYAWGYYSGPRAALCLLEAYPFLKKHNLPGGE